MPSPDDPTKGTNFVRRTPALDALTQAFNGFIYICSQDHRIEYMDDKLQERIGYDATGEHCYRVLYDQKDVCPWCNNDHLFRDQKPHRFQLKNPRDERWYDIVNIPVCNNDGTFSKQTLLVDITESYLVKDELSLLQALVNQSNDAIFVIDADTSAFIYVNEKACSSLGYSKAELLSLKVYDIATNIVDMPSWQNQVARIQKESLLFETEQVCKDGRHIPVEINASFVLRQGRPFIISVVRDISERKDQNRALLEERNKFESLLSTLADGITVQDRDYKILYQNKVHADKQGMHTGEYCYQAYQQRETVCPGCLLAQTFIDGEIHRHVTTASTDKGTIHLEVTSCPMKDAEGKIVAGIESVRDITAQIKLEERLRQAQKMAAMGTLAGGVAHDFNNILTPILGYSELALSGLSPNDPLADNLQQVIKAAERAKDLVLQILSFSRHAPQERKALHPQLVVKEALKLIQASLPSTIEIRAEISSACGTIVADPTQLHQVVMNLCTNAYQAMRESGGVLGVRLANVTIEDDSKTPHCELAGGNYVVLEISDTGCGIKQETIDNIFDPYFTTKNTGEGTGLGLAVVHGIVKSCQGTITVKSEPGEGTNFHVYLPRMQEATSVAGAVDSIVIPTGTERLLVVDDEEVVVNLMQSILQSFGYQVTTLNSSRDALALIEQDPMAFDLVLTDMTMPNLTGLELAQKALAIRPDLPVILCTGFSDLITTEQVMALGLRAYLMKPISVRELGKTVRDVLDMETGGVTGSSSI